MDTSLRDRLIGQLLDGRYEVQSRIARGGMATVYLAVDRRLDRDVALKVMHPHLSEDPDFVDRFVREARSAARLSHPNVVQVFDQGADGDEGDEVLYLAMELLSGRTLREILNERGVLTPREALTVTESVLDALSAAHRAGIVHRDIKPENVILTDEGRVKVADFGLARAMGSGPTQTGALMGTVAYLPPELVSQGTSDGRGDVYATGIMLFEMLTGRQPFTGNIPVQVAYRHVHEDVPKPSTLIPELPSELDDLVAVAVTRDPDERVPDAATWLAKLRSVRRALVDDVLDYRPSVDFVEVEDPAAAGASSGNSATGRAAGPVFAETTALESPFTSTSTSISDPAAGPPPGRVTYPTQALPQLDDLRMLRERSLRDLDDEYPFDDDEDLEEYPDDAPDADDRGGPAVRDGAETSRHGAEHAHQSTKNPDEYLDLANRRRRRRRRGLSGLAVLLGLTLLLSVLGWWQVAGPGRYTTTPSLTGQTQAQAQAALSSAGLTMEVGEAAYDEAVPKGKVIDTVPEPGGRVKKHGTVTIQLSLGSAKRSVPKLAGLSVEEATALLGDNDLKLGRTTQDYSDTVEPDVIISSSPGSGSPRTVGDSVAVTVSKGAKPVDVPDVQGWWQNEAESTLSGAGFNVEVQTEENQQLQQGQVIRTDPSPGTQAPKGSKVVLVVAQGAPVQVPSVIGWQLGDARQALSDLGLQVQVDQVAGGRVRVVVGQDPAGGSVVAPGTLITLSAI